MIEHSKETLLSFPEASRRLPCGRAGRPTHPSTINRWAKAGLRGIRLETICVGGSRFTSIEALQRFFERLSRQYEEVGR